MTEKEWKLFKVFRNDFKKQCSAWSERVGYAYSPPEDRDCSAKKYIPQEAFPFTIAQMQKKLALKDAVPEYTIETPLVYNHSLDSITKDDTIALIIVGDNPGKMEQLHKNQKYLVGHSGTIADRFFKKNSELGIDFRKNVIILNKTPLHTAKTKELKGLMQYDNKEKQLEFFFIETQKWMAEKTAQLQKDLGCFIWLIGYSELRPKGLFSHYAHELQNAYMHDDKKHLYLYQHFSMNCFTTDLKKRFDHTCSLQENLAKIGLLHRREILGW